MPTPIGKNLGSVEATKEKGGYFRLGFGIHQQDRLHYEPGEIIPSPKSDLTKHNTDPRQPKFVRVPDDEAKKELARLKAAINKAADVSEQEPTANDPGYDRQDLEAMTVADLKELAEAEGIDIQGLNGKKALIDVLAKS